MDRIKRYFYLYQRGVWYLQQAVGEFRKPLILFNEAAIGVLLLDSWGVPLGPLPTLALYTAGCALLVGIGVMLVRGGVTKFNSSLANQQSPELLEILERVKRIEEKVESKKQ